MFYIYLHGTTAEVMTMCSCAVLPGYQAAVSHSCLDLPLDRQKMDRSLLLDTAWALAIEFIRAVLRGYLWWVYLTSNDLWCLWFPSYTMVDYFLIRSRCEICFDWLDIFLRSCTLAQQTMEEKVRQKANLKLTRTVSKASCLKRPVKVQ